MTANERALNTSILLLIPPGVLALAWALYNFPVGKIGGGLITLSIVTVFFSGFLRIDLPRTKLHLTISDALIFLSLLFYGGGLAIVLAMGEAAFSSLRLGANQAGKSRISMRTILMNVLIAGFSTFTTAFIVKTLFGPEESILSVGNNTSLATCGPDGSLVAVCGKHFLAAASVSKRSGRKLLEVWNEYCVKPSPCLQRRPDGGLLRKPYSKPTWCSFAMAVGFFALYTLLQAVLRTMSRWRRQSRKV